MTELEHIYNEFSSMVYNLALHYTRSVEDAEEITQDVFIKVDRKLGHFRGDASLKTWIYRITVNQCLDVLKSKNSLKNSPWQFSISLANSPENTQQTPHKILENKQQLNRLMDCIHQLPDDQRDVILLLKVEGCSQEETASILNRSPKAIESLFHRAKTALKKLWIESNETK